MGGLGATEILLIVLVALLLFGAGRIADIGKGLGEGIRNFKKGLRDDSSPADKALSATDGAKPFGELDRSENSEQPAGEPKVAAVKKPADESATP